MTYRIRRFYFDCPERHGEVIATGLTLDEAQEHCSDPETSSSTCTEAESVARTEAHGAWFDGYDEE